MAEFFKTEIANINTLIEDQLDQAKIVVNNEKPAQTQTASAKPGGSAAVFSRAAQGL